MSNLLLRIEQLTVSYEKRNLLKNVSLTIHQGEIIGLVGESGSGKSLTSLAIMGLLPKNFSVTGNISFYKDGNEISLLPRTTQGESTRGKDITIIFQDALTALNPVMKIGKQASEGMRWHLNLDRQSARTRLLNLFRQLQLFPEEQVYQSYPHELSGGQRQRVMLATASSVRPSLLIADEPTTALDPIVQKEIIDLLRFINSSEGISILFISHDLALVRQLCQKVWVMKNGEIVEAGDISSIFFNPSHDYTQMLIGSLPRSVKCSESMIQQNEVLLSVRNLTVSYKKGRRKQRVLQHVSFDVHKGEIVGLLGRSGEGKSTLARTLLKLQPADNGQIIFEGKDLMQFTSKEMLHIRPRMQIIFQDSLSSFHPSRTFESQLLEPMNIHGIFNNRKERIDYLEFLFEKTELPISLLKSYPYQASGGQRQRLQIVRALALKPSLLILDEAISALDVHLKKQILDLLLKIKSEFNLTYLFISHEINYVLYFCTSVIVLKDAQLVEHAPVNEFMSNPISDEAKMFMQAYRFN